MSGLRRAAAAGVAFLASTVVFMPHTSAAAAETAAVPSPAAVATVLFVDATTGKVTKTWTGSPADAAKILDQEAAKLPPRTTAPKQTRIPPATTSISRQSPCTANTGYFEVRNYPPLVCFANRGSINVFIDQVYQVLNGNNVAAFAWTNSAGTTFVTTMPTKFSSVSFNSRVVVNEITIQ